MRYGSTIRQKKGTCKHPGCGKNGPVTKGLCSVHYWMKIRLKSAAKFEEQELEQNESLSTVMQDLDVLFSQWIRLKASDDNGYCVCYGCGAVHYYTEMQCCHYIPRSHKNTRYLEENCVCGCSFCNKNEGGKLSSYSEHFGNLIERDRSGGVEALEEQARMEYSYTVSEVKGLISFYSKEVGTLRKKKPLKI